MIIEDGKIKVCTEDELFTYWMKRYDNAFSYVEFRTGCVAKGTKIVGRECSMIRSRYCYTDCNWFETCPILEYIENDDSEYPFFEEDEDL